MTTTAVPRPVTPAAILASRLDALARRVDAADHVTPALHADLRAELRAVRDLSAGLDPYLSRWSTPESPALARLAERTATQSWAAAHLEPEMLTGHVEGQLLKMLVHATRARRVLDVGMFTGYSALAMAEALPADGTVLACEIDAEAAAFAVRAFRDAPGGAKITVETGPAQHTLDRLDAPFELIFVDADKAGYGGYLATVLDRGLLAAHGLLCVDNTLMQGQPWCAAEPTPNGRAIAAFNRAVAAEPRVEQVILPLRDGLTLVRRVTAGNGPPCATPC